MCACGWNFRVHHTQQLSGVSYHTPTTRVPFPSFKKIDQSQPHKLTELHERARDQGLHRVLGKLGHAAVRLAGEDGPEQVQDREPGETRLAIDRLIG